MEDAKEAIQTHASRGRDSTTKLKGSVVEAAFNSAQVFGGALLLLPRLLLLTSKYVLAMVGLKIDPSKAAARARSTSSRRPRGRICMRLRGNAGANLAGVHVC